ncbi:MAG: CsgG/HfaB family protein [Pseudomonadota bacterium]
MILRIRKVQAVLLAALLAASSVISGTAHAEYLAHAVGEKNRIPLPERIDPIDSKYLLNLDWGAYEGAKARVAVLEVDNTSNSNSFSMTGPSGQTVSWSYDNANQVPVNGIEAIVTDVMNQTNRFRLIERQALSSIIQEQDLATSGRVAKPSGAATGNILGAQFLVQVVITDYEANVKGSKGGGIGGLVANRVPVLGGIGLKRGQGRVGMNFRLIDAETSEVMYTKQIESVIKESGLTVGGIGFGGGGALGGFFSNYSKTPIGQAVIAGINKGVYDLVKEIGAAPAKGSIIRTNGGKIWVNMGKGSVEVGDVLTVMSKGEELIDPDTGISLGSMDTELGNIRVSQTSDKFSVADVVSLSGTAKRGDQVISTAPPPSIEYASSWKKPKRGKF